MAKTPDWKLDCFLQFLPNDYWVVKNLFGPRLGVKSYCKICDVYVISSETESHLKIHIKERDVIIKRRKKEAKERRDEALRLARLARLEEKNI